MRIYFVVRKFLVHCPNRSILLSGCRQLFLVTECTVHHGSALLRLLGIEHLSCIEWTRTSNYEKKLIFIWIHINKTLLRET